MPTIKRDLDKLKGRTMWASWGSTKQKARFWTWFRLLPDTYTSWEKDSLRVALLRNLGVLTDEKLNMIQQCVWLQPKKPIVSWVPTEEGWPEVWGRQLSLPALSSWDLMWSILSRSGVAYTERYRAFGEGPEAFLQEDDPRASPMKTGWRS